MQYEQQTDTWSSIRVFVDNLRNNFWIISFSGFSELTTSVEGSAAASNPNQEAIDHINQAQSALDNGDT